MLLALAVSGHGGQWANFWQLCIKIEYFGLSDNLELMANVVRPCHEESLVYNNVKIQMIV